MRQTTKSCCFAGARPRFWGIGQPWVVLLLCLALLGATFTAEAKDGQNGNGKQKEDTAGAPADSIDAGPTASGNTAFQDLPKDHWAFKIGRAHV